MNTKPAVLSLKVRRTRTSLRTNLSTGAGIPDSGLRIAIPDSALPRQGR